MSVDWESEGLLKDLEGKAREGRRELLDELHESGLTLDELRDAVNEGRLVLLPLEQALMGDGARLSQDEVAEKSGVEVETLRKNWRALGMPEPEEGEKIFTEHDVEAAKQVKQLLDIGIPENELLQVSRVIGMTMSQLAAANRGLGVRVFAEEGDSELEVGKRFAAIAEGVGPLLGSILEYALQLHMREQIRHDAFASTEISAEVEAGLETAIAFATWSASPSSGSGWIRRDRRLDGRALEHGIGGRRGPGAAGEADRRRGDADLEGPQVPA